MTGCISHRSRAGHIANPRTTPWCSSFAAWSTSARPMAIAGSRRERDKAGEPPVNHKRVFRIMRRNSMLLARHTGSRNGRVHDGKVIVMRSNLRWCSDGFEISCWNGDLIRIAFIIDAHDREIIAWHAVVGSGISGSMVRDMMLEAVESRFGALQAPAPIEWL